MKGERPVLLTGKPAKRSAVSLIFTALALLIFLAVCGEIVFRGMYTAYEIDGPSMQETFFTGDWVYAGSRIEPRRGDVVIVDVGGHPAFLRGTIVKRLIALEGDSVMWRDGVVYRKIGDGDYEPLDEPYVTGETSGYGEVTLGAGEIFVMGDNRTESFDCRNPKVGALKAEDIIGVVPQWAIEKKADIARWELFRLGVRNFIYDLFD